jgi:hypothetical protein
MSDPSTTPRCTALKKDGAPCGAAALPGEPFCPFHDPARAHSFHEGRRKGGQAPRRLRRLPIILDHMHIAELLSEQLIHAANHPDSFDPRRLQALTAASRALLKTVGVPKDTHLVHYHRGQPLPTQPHLLRLYPALDPTIAALLVAEAADDAPDGEYRVNGKEEESFDAAKHPDPDEDPTVEQRSATAWPRRARLKPDSTLATPLPCYDQFGSLDPNRLQRWQQEHPTPVTASPATASPFPSREGGQGVRSAPHPALEELPECRLQAASAAPASPAAHADEQGLDKPRTSPPARDKKGDREPSATPLRVPNDFGTIPWEEALRASPHVRGHADWIIGLFRKQAAAGSQKSPPPAGGTRGDA